MIFSALAFAADPAIMVHLDQTVRDLRTTDAGHLSVETRIRRASLLDVLESYVAAGQVPQNQTEAEGHAAPIAVDGGMEHTPGRNPVFIDGNGTHCAVGYLLAVDGREDLVADAVERDNHGYLTELASPALEAWAQGSGFTLQELARIQPSYRWGVEPAGRNLAIGAAIDASGTCAPLWNPGTSAAVFRDFESAQGGLEGVDLPLLPDSILDCAMKHPTKPYMMALLLARVRYHNAGRTLPPKVCDRVVELYPTTGALREDAKRAVESCGREVPVLPDESPKRRESQAPRP